LKSAFLAFALVLSENAAMAAGIGVIGLYQNGTKISEAGIKALGCTLQRQGIVVAQQGKINLNQPDQFVVLACDLPVLVQSEYRYAIANLFDDGTAIALFEGALTEVESPAGQLVVSEREYILKIGFYNNLDVDDREADLLELQNKTEPRKGRWKTEAFLQVHYAVGISTPDEIVVLYYDNPEEANQFRGNNKDILNDVRAFNAAHLTGFTYLIGAATR